MIRIQARFRGLISRKYRDVPVLLRSKKARTSAPYTQNTSINKYTIVTNSKITDDDIKRLFQK